MSVLTLSCNGGEVGAGAGALCGNGLADPGEQCDDGNRLAGDICSPECTLYGPQPVCGNFAREYGEECDDGNLFDGDFCTHDCKRPGSVCGNRFLEGMEECDDGNLRNGDCCDFTCFREAVCTPQDANIDAPLEGDQPPLDLPDLPDPLDLPDPQLEGRDTDLEFTDQSIDLPTDGADAVDLCIDGTCPLMDCDLWEQRGCGRFEKCTLVGIDRVCIPAGTFTEGQICTSESDCAANLSCLSNGGVERLCFRFCRNDSNCFGTGSLCIYDILYGGAPIPGVKLCSKSCDPVSNIGCPDSFSCMIYQEPGGLRRFLTDCAPHAGEGRDGDSCESDIECAPGFFCMPGAGRCARYCRYPTGYCVDGTCNAFTPRVILGGVEYGFCWQTT